MNLFNLQNKNKKERKRVGRGMGSGSGKTSGRGQKGQKSRSGYKRKAGFEGGQTPFYRRIPKYGFRNINYKKYTIINLNIINEKYSAEETVSRESLIKKNLISKKNKDLIKILGNGKLEKKIYFKVDKVTKQAIERNKDYLVCK